MVSSALPHFDVLYVISDLHLGGPPGKQIFNQGKLLAALIDHVRQSDPDRTVGLVLAGDIVDFLADQEPDYFKTPMKALRSLRAVMTDPTFRDVFVALRRFVQTAYRQLVLLLGNHDLELALPEVREELTEQLCAWAEFEGTDGNLEPIPAEQADAARGRLRLILDVTGLLCNVGGAEVLCIHGNEVDEWNRVDPARLVRVSAAANRKSEEAPWVPNAGSQLVIDVMNPIKARYPFVDLLKPEDEIVIPVLAAMARMASTQPKDETGKRIEGIKWGSVPSIVVRQGLGVIGRWFWLGEESPTEAGELFVTAPQLPSDELMAQVERDLLAGLSPLDLVSADEEQTLGLFSSVVHIGDFLRRARKLPPERALREGLQRWLHRDATFDLASHDQTYQRIDKLVSQKIDVVIAGHTHLARAIDRPGGGIYYNSGTWIRLIQLTLEQLQSDGNFQQICKALQHGTMEALDACPGLIMSMPTVVCIREDEGAVTSALYKCQSSGGVLTVTPMPGTVRQIQRGTL